MSAQAAELQAHLDALKDGTAPQINEILTEQCSLVLPRELSQQDSVALVKTISSLAPELPLDPTPLNKLLIALLEPYSFSDILSLSDNIDFVTGLSVRAVPYNRLLLAILAKATLDPSDAATVAGRPEVVSALITLWLTTTDPGIGSEAGRVVYGLLKIDHQPEGFDTAVGQGFVWKRVFQDRDVYGLLFSICAWDTSKSQHDLSRHQRTLAQSRLLELLPRLCTLDWSAITRSHDASIEQSYCSTPSRGLLGFAALDMVNTQDDVLMHKCLIEFFSDLIETATASRADTTRYSSVSLDFVVATGIHDRLIDFYVDPDENRHGVLEVQFLYSSMAKYVATYASTYPDHFAKLDGNTKILDHLRKALNLSPSHWAHQESPKYDLHVLVSLPRAFLLPSMGTQGRAENVQPSVISLIPTKQTSPDALNALGTIFNGPSAIESLTFPEESPMMSSIDEKGMAEAQAARALYYLYLTRYNSNMYSDLVSHAESIALTETALAAINLLTSIITSHWAPLPNTRRRGMLSEPELFALLPSPPPATPESGSLAVIAPPALEYIMPYFIHPGRSLANIVGGRGDVDSVGYKVAVAKYEALKALHDSLKEVADTSPEEGYEEILASLRRPLARGPWSQTGEMGGRLATMEM